jgi:phosphate transport system substrate-binding protein
LTGAWANRPIKVYGLDENTGTAQYFASRVLEEGRWNCDLELPPGAPQTMFRGSGGKAADALIEALQHDPYAIGIGGFRNAGSELKALAVGEKDSGPFIQGTKATVADRSYPLSRNIYLFVDKDPAKAWDPKVQEFLRFVLSSRGQAGIAEEGGYLPLPGAVVAQEREKVQ